VKEAASGQGTTDSRPYGPRGQTGLAKRLGQWGEVEHARGRACWPKAKAQAAGPKTGAGPNSRNKPFRILFGIRIFCKLWIFVQGDLEGILT
jgi:hypothetical protein